MFNSYEQIIKDTHMVVVTPTYAKYTSENVSDS